MELVGGLPFCFYKIGSTLVTESASTRRKRFTVTIYNADENQKKMTNDENYINVNIDL